MPLEKAAAGTPGFSRNVATEVNAGKPQKQAVAIAYEKARGDANSSNPHLKDYQRNSVELTSLQGKLATAQRLGNHADYQRNLAKISSLEGRLKTNQRLAAEWEREQVTERKDEDGGPFAGHRGPNAFGNAGTLKARADAISRRADAEERQTDLLTGGGKTRGDAEIVQFTNTSGSRTAVVDEVRGQFSVTFIVNGRVKDRVYFSTKEAAVSKAKGWTRSSRGDAERDLGGEATGEA